MTRCTARKAKRNVGRWSLETVSDAPIRADAGAMFGATPSTVWRPLIDDLDERRRMALGLHCLLLRDEKRTILIDAGMGALRSEDEADAYGLDPSARTLPDALSDIDVAPEDVDIVILTHLHLDHAGWCMRPNPQKPEKAVPAFPRATHIVQRAEWEAAHSDNPRIAADYHREDIDPIKAAGLLEIIDGEVEITPGVRLVLTAAHSPGHQAILLNDGGQALLHPGDIIPTRHHLREDITSAYDLAPARVAEARAILLDAACDGCWLVFLNHEPDQPLGRIHRADSGEYVWTAADDSAD